MHTRCKKYLGFLAVYYPSRKMKQATIEQKLKLLAELATTTDHRGWNGDRFQILLGLSASDFDAEFAKLLNEWRPSVSIPKSNVICVSTLPEAELPAWSKPVIVGATELRFFTIDTIFANVWSHVGQEGYEPHVTGHKIFKALVSAYEDEDDKESWNCDGMSTYGVTHKDLINNHFGLRELQWQRSVWQTLPKSFREWARCKNLYAWAGAVRNKNSRHIMIPYLDCSVEDPPLCWRDLCNQWNTNDLALCENPIA